MTAPDRTPAIIACMRDLAERDMDDPAQRSAGDACDAHTVYIALMLACDDVAAFALWPLTGADEMIAAGLWRFLRGEAPRFTSIDDATRAQRVALRFAAVAIAAAPGLGDPPPEVRWLWDAAGRLANLSPEPAAPVEFKKPTMAEVLERIEARELANLRGEASATTGALADLAAALAETGRGLTDATDDERIRDAAKWIRLLMSKVGGAKAAPAVQVGDIIDAKDVPPGTLVEYKSPGGPLLTIRLPSGRGYHLTPDGDNGGDSWPWGERGPVRVMATDLGNATADRVAMMTPAEAREWLAQRVAATPAY